MKIPKLLMAIALAATLTYGCNAQEQHDKKDNQTKNQPEISWSVEKEVDEDGNLIRYDSTYTWSYTNVEGDSSKVEVDSVMKNFRSYFHKNFPSTWDHGFGDPTWNDPLFYHDFFRHDYFHHRWKEGHYEVEKMLRRMDSMRMQFLHEQYPGLLISPKGQNKKRKKNN